ncbi:uncharacterized protein B0P05DRAFT_540447 [Gilbertella persicaria]|uniref:uncharacterized protein n=1 Tax=Gilbertella persicaria TaxID=101096 RepID=UPI00221EF40B|nr:uncharacterized protein B0P05DRAFT_540447 [Gilbertella persicaria]KAI8080215.1 hypothetical protein B0P05DRAFT_540447 [Gilbertella persicaria]
MVHILCDIHLTALFFSFFIFPIFCCIYFFGLIPRNIKKYSKMMKFYDFINREPALLLPLFAKIVIKLAISLRHIANGLPTAGNGEYFYFFENEKVYVAMQLVSFGVT